MKSALFVAALAAAISFPALAQDTSQTTTSGSMPASGDPSMQTPGTDTTQPPASTTMPDSTMPQGSAPMPAPQSAMPAPDSTMSNPPASGAMSTPQGSGAMSPPMASGMPMSNAPAAGDPSTYPVCSKTVTDRCVNRSSAMMMKKKKKM